MKDIKRLINAILFEDNINETLRPDHFNKEYSSSSIHNTKGPKINGDNSYTSSYEELQDLPIASSEVMTDHITTSKLDFDNLISSEYDGPKNKTELMRAINSGIQDLDLSKKQIDIMWNKNLNLLKKFRGQK
tara:strand:+ start:833 stop:1228 length:396 start_codon:yes stop_codon:yes gene_type:complete